tara:strand:- start:27 stop:317 length:291 start_codon:yes stop_codon:yes gene_type:complete
MKIKNIKASSFSHSAERGFITTSESFTMLDDKSYPSSSKWKWTGAGFRMIQLDGKDIPFHRSVRSWLCGRDMHMSIKEMLNSNVPLDCVKVAIAKP